VKKSRIRKKNLPFLQQIVSFMPHKTVKPVLLICRGENEKILQGMKSDFSWYKRYEREESGSGDLSFESLNAAGDTKKK